MDNDTFLSLAQNVRVIASKHSWLEGEALLQLKTTAKMQKIQQVVGLPDLHPGRGYPIGAAFLSTDHLYPALVGNDIGCGMSLWQTECKISKLKLDKLTRRLANIEEPLDESWFAFINQRKRELGIEDCVFHYANLSLFDISLGTIGGGNHFAEYQKVSEIYDEALFSKAGLNKSCLQLLVHSGSRGLGQAVLRYHIDHFNHQGIAINEPALEEYLKQHDIAVNWAKLNRQLIAMRFLEALGCDGHSTLDSTHNFVERLNENDFLHRKGCAPMTQNLLVIPGSRGCHSYLVQPLLDKAELSLYSLAHGAGRKWQRSECQARLKENFNKTKLTRTELGSHVICENKALLYEEAPQAYKNVTQVIQDLINAGLIKLVAKLQPVLTFKTMRK